MLNPTRANRAAPAVPILGSMRSTVQLMTRRLATAALVAALLAAPGAAAAQTPLHPTPHALHPRLYFSLRTPAEPVISPDGRRVAFTVRTPDFERGQVREEIWIAGLGGVLAGAEPARQLTSSRSGAWSPAFSPDGRRLAFLSDDALAGESDDDALPQVWLLPLAGGAPTRLTASAAGVEHFEWMPDGESIIYLQEEEPASPVAAHQAALEERRLDARRHVEPPPFKDLWRVSLDGDAGRLLRFERGLSDFRISPTGEWIALVSNPTGDPDDDRLDDLWVVRTMGGAPRRLTTRPYGEYDPRWSPDGRWLAFTALRDTAIGYSNPDLWVMAIADCLQVPSSGTGIERPCRASLSDSLDRDVIAYRWTSATELLASVQQGATPRLLRVTLAGTAATGPSVRFAPVPADSGAAFDAFDAVRSTAVALVEGPSAWPDLWEINLQAAQPRSRTAAPVRWRRLTHLNPALDSVRLGRQEVVRWRSRDGETVEGVLVLPPTGSPPFPLVVAVHGGPHGAAENVVRGYYTPQLYAARGYAVLLPNYRGSAGYGNRWATANRGDLGGRDWEDIEGGVEELVRRGIADSARLAMKGLSYGGYMTNWALTRTTRFRAGVSESGIASFVTDFSNSNIPSWERDYLLARHWENPRIYAERSPLTYVDRITTPLLLIHGDEDPNTAPANSIELWRALTTLGRTVELIRYPREGHGFDEPAHRLDKFRREIAWLDRWVLGLREWGLGDDVPSADSTWVLRVTNLDEEDGYIAVTLLVRRLFSSTPYRPTPSGPTPLSVFDWSRAATLDNHPPIGLATTVLGHTALVRSSDLTTTIGADEDATAIRLAFPEGSCTRTTLEPCFLRVEGFPVVLLRP